MKIGDRVKVKPTPQREAGEGIVKRIWPEAGEVELEFQGAAWFYPYRAVFKLEEVQP